MHISKLESLQLFQKTSHFTTPFTTPFSFKMTFFDAPRQKVRTRKNLVK